jgi:hypothetical protein
LTEEGGLPPAADFSVCKTTTVKLGGITVTEEIWKDIESWPFHQVSNRGRVRVLPGGRFKNRTIKEIEFRKLTSNSDGYMTVGRWKGEERKLETYRVHALILNAFYGPCPPGQECRHLNGNPSDNRWPENIKWDTHEKNVKDQIEHGTSGKGQRNGNSKLTRSQVDDIRSRSHYWGINTSLAAEFGVSHVMISYIRSGKNWVE